MNFVHYLLASLGFGVITAASASYVGNGPTKSGQVVVKNLSAPGARVLRGTATATGDGASATFDVNFVDGTEVLSFTPSGVICQRIGGAATGSIYVQSVSAITTTKFTVNTSANVNAATFIVAFEVF